MHAVIIIIMLTLVQMLLANTALVYFLCIGNLEKTDQPLNFLLSFLKSML